MRTLFLLSVICLFKVYVVNAQIIETAIWEKLELDFTSTTTYDNVLYDVKTFEATFTSATGRSWTVNGFWDGDKNWKIRFLPDELGTWTYQTTCSDANNTGLHQQSGTFQVIPGQRSFPLYQRGAVATQPGSFYLTYTDGTPFFWTACTAWNGALKSTPADWDRYLKQRREHSYNTIQYVTTQWRGCELNAEDQVAFTGSGRLEINPDFFRRIDERTDAINDHGLLAAPVLLWALPFGDGRHLSPGYYLPHNEAVLLAKYIVARLQGNHVLWILGGDGRYTGDYEQRWKTIGRKVFHRPVQAPVTLHPSGLSWIGEDYAKEDWLDVIAYQSTHSTSQRNVDWITQGPPNQTWAQLPAKPIINMEPNYENIHFKVTARDVRNASYWSVLATPTAGITYGANGIWPWIEQPGELIENHRNPDGKGPNPWYTCIEYDGSKQIGLLSDCFQQYEWWTLRPAPDLLLEQPGEITYNHFVSVSADATRSLVIIYLPESQAIQLRLPVEKNYRVRWFDPVKGAFNEEESRKRQQLLSFSPPGNNQDWVLVLEQE